MSTIFKLTLDDGKTITMLVGDITQQDTDAIVNAANSSLMGGGGVDGAIHRAGGPVILEECKKIVADRGPLPPGDVVATTAGRMKAAYVLHTVGPIWQGGDRGEPETLARCYSNSIALADRMRLHSIAFPAISTGAYGYPPGDAAVIALNTSIESLRGTRHVKDVRFVLFAESALELYSRLATTISRESNSYRLDKFTGTISQ